MALLFFDLELYGQQIWIKLNLFQKPWFLNGFNNDKALQYPTKCVLDANWLVSYKFHGDFHHLLSSVVLVIQCSWAVPTFLHGLIDTAQNSKEFMLLRARKDVSHAFFHGVLQLFALERGNEHDTKSRHKVLLGSRRYANYILGQIVKGDDLRGHPAQYGSRGALFCYYTWRRSTLWEFSFFFRFVAQLKWNCLTISLF